MDAGRKRPSSKLVLICAVVVTGGLALLASVQSWIDIVFLPGVATVEELIVPGQKVSPALTLIALAVLASALVLTIAGPVFRRVLGVLLVALGAGLITVGATAMASPLEGARAQIEAVSGISGSGQESLVGSVEVTLWPGVMVAIGVLAALIGALIVLVGGKWKTGGRKYEANRSKPATKAGTTREPDRISDWEALSDGDDPTED